MRKYIVLVLLALCVIINGCSKRDSQDAEKELSKEQKITEKVDEQKEELSGKTEVSDETEDSKKQDIAESNNASIKGTPVENRKHNISEYQLTTPKKYTRVNHNDHIYVYDENGNSLNISIQSLKIKVDEYSKDNYHQLISSTYKDVKLQDLQHTTIDGLKTLYIEYTGKKNDKDFINCRYFVENGEYTILIDLQAIDEANYKLLKSTVESIKF